jgi:hypothetical protein
MVRVVLDQQRVISREAGVDAVERWFSPVISSRPITAQVVRGFGGVNLRPRPSTLPARRRVHCRDALAWGGMVGRAIQGSALRSRLTC